MVVPRGPKPISELPGLEALKVQEANFGVPRIIHPMGLQRHPFKNYTGGVNLRDGPVNLESNEAQDALNMQLTLRGALRQRKGKTQFDVSGFPAGKRAEHLRNWYNGPTNFLIASIDGDIFSFSTTGAGTSRFVGTDGSVWVFEDAEDGFAANQLWAMNGVDAAQKWDGASASTSAWGGPPPAGSMCRVWRNKMVVSGVASTPQRVLFSNIGDPEVFTPTDWIDIKTTEDDLDPVTWIDILEDLLIVFKRRSVWAVFDPTNFANRRIGTPGCESRFQSVEFGGRVYYLARDGVYSTNGTDTRLESDLITPIFTEDLNMAHIDKSRMMATRDRRILVAVPTGAALSPDLMLEYVPELASRRSDTGETTAPWVFHSYPVSSMCTFRPVNDDIVIAGAGDDEKLHQLFNGTNDDGAAIDASYFGSWRSIFPEEPFERVRRINVMHTGQLDVELFSDLDNSSPAFSGSISAPVPEDPLWDGGQWEGGVWDPASATVLSRVRPEVRAQYHAVRFRNNVLDKTFEVYSAEMAIRGGKEH